MAPQWYGHDRGLKARMGLTMLGLGALYVVFMSVIIAAGASAAVVLVIAAVIMVFQLLFSDRMALASMGAREVDAAEAPQVHAIIDRLCQLADIPKPRIALADTDMPNAFATGRSRKSATVCVTSGLLRRLEPAELEGVLAHELTHVVNRDVVVMTVASFLATVAGLLIRMSAWGRVGGGRDNTAVVFLAVVGVSIVTYAVSFVLLRTLSRYREFAADRGAAILTGAPSQLASALTKLSDGMARIPMRDLRSAEAMNAFFIMPAVAKGFSLSSLFATHPPIERRIERLMALQAQLDARMPV
ncbi:MAG: zinc metalloprotease HtpX [Thermoleophilia bacterium]